MISDFIRELYDLVDGGPARAFECLLCRSGRTAFDKTSAKFVTVTPTLKGMYTHLRLTHKWTGQLNLNIYTLETWQAEQLARRNQLRTVAKPGEPGYQGTLHVGAVDTPRKTDDNG